jgi:hypothetical protein
VAEQFVRSVDQVHIHAVSDRLLGERCYKIALGIGGIIPMLLFEQLPIRPPTTRTVLLSRIKLFSNSSSQRFITIVKGSHDFAGTQNVRRGTLLENGSNLPRDPIHPQDKLCELRACDILKQPIQWIDALVSPQAWMTKRYVLRDFVLRGFRIRHYRFERYGTKQSHHKSETPFNSS